MNEDEEEADEEEHASQAAQQPASEADLGPSIEEVDAAVRLVSGGLTHHICVLLFFYFFIIAMFMSIIITVVVVVIVVVVVGCLACIWLACSQAQNWGMGVVRNVLASRLWPHHMVSSLCCLSLPNCVVMWQ